MSANFHDEPALGDRVTNLRGGDLPGLAATLRVAKLLPDLVLVRDSEGDGCYLHRSPGNPTRWNLGSRTVAFAPAGPDGSSARPTGSPASEPEAPTPPPPAPARQPQTGDRAALPDGTDSGYQVGEVSDRAAATGHPSWVLLRRSENRSFVVMLRPDVRANGYVLNGHKLEFLPPAARCCDLCGQLFVPDDFADQQVCGECADTDTVPELHEGAEQQGLGRVRVRCTCGLATSWQPLGTLARTSLRAAWDEHAGHALSALREAVRVAAATR